MFRTDDFSQGRDHPGRQAAARDLAVRRRHAHLCRARERRPARRDRHADQHGDRDDSDRPGAAGRRLCAERGAGRATAPQGLQPLGVAGAGGAADAGARAEQRRRSRHAPTSVALFDQGLPQVLQAAVTGLEPRQPYVLALSPAAGRRWRARAAGDLHDQPGRRRDRQRARTDPPDRSRTAARRPRRYLVIAPGTASQHGAPVQVQSAGN